VTVAAAENIAERAATLIELGRPADAIVLLHSGLAEHPDDPALLDALARACLDTDVGAAADAAERLAAAAPHSHRGYLLGSIAASAVGDRRRAVQLAKLAVENGPHSALSHAQLAQALSISRQHRRARAAAQTALELAPNTPTPHVAAGNVELANGQTKRARRHFERALELDPTDTVAQANLAIAQRADGNAGKALAELESALHLDPRDPGARRVLDRVLHGAIVDLQWVWLGLTTLLLFIETR
jgi:tetratricopeptide (TPR) repeat protein